MDILSLPDEMISSVSKYLWPSVMVSLRKRNSRINKVAKRAGLSKLSVEAIRIDAATVHICLDLNLANTYGLEQNQFTPRTNFQCHADLLEYILPKVKVTDEFEYCCSQRFDDAAFLTLERYKNSVKYGETLRYFCGQNQGLSREHHKRILSLFPRCKKLRSSLPGYFGVADMLSVEALSDRKWDFIIISSSEYFGGALSETLNDHFLLNIAPKCEEFVFRSFNGKCYFTFSGMLQLLENLSSKQPSRVRWSLGPIDIYDMDLNETTQQLKGIPGLFMEISELGLWWNRKIGHEIKIQLGKNVSVEFTLIKFLGEEYENFVENNRRNQNVIE